jgi:uncharacterized protein with gpF-like domain
MRDGDTRDAHDEADGQEVGTDEDFAVGGEALRFPADPAGSAGNTINCRCSVLPIIPAERSTDRSAKRTSSSSTSKRERHAARNAWIRSEYDRRVDAGRGESRDVVLDELQTGTVGGEAYAISRRQVRRIVDER